MVGNSRIDLYHWEKSGEGSGKIRDFYLKYMINNIALKSIYESYGWSLLMYKIKINNKRIEWKCGKISQRSIQVIIFPQD